MNSLNIFDSIKDIEPSLALFFHVQKSYWKQIKQIFDWYMIRKPGIYVDEPDREEKWFDRYDTKIDAVRKTDWDNYPIKDTYGLK